MLSAPKTLLLHHQRKISAGHVLREAPHFRTVHGDGARSTRHDAAIGVQQGSIACAVGRSRTNLTLGISSVTPRKPSGSVAYRDVVMASSVIERPPISLASANHFVALLPK